MKLKSLLLSASIALVFIFVFIIDAAMKNLEGELGILLYVRGGLVVIGFVLLYFILLGFHKEIKITSVQRIGRIAMWAGIFIALNIITSFLPLNEFESRDLRIFPRDYLTILFSSVLSITAGTVTILTVLNVREMLLYKKKKGTKRNYWLLLISFFGTSFTTINLRPLESSTLTTLLFVLSIALIIINSFRLSWIAYLSRREKIYAMLYALLAFFVFMAVNVILSEKWFLFKALRYYSYPLQTFVQQTAILGSVYFGMTFISTMFHLPTAAAFDRKRTEISSLHNLSRLITQVFDFQDLAESVTKLTLEVSESISTWLEIMPEGGTLSKPHSRESIVSFRNITMEEIETILFGSPDSVRLLAIHSQKPVIIDDVAHDRRAKYFSSLKKIGSMVVIPLISHDVPIGILYATKEMDYGYDQDEVDVLTGFADQATIAIENARLIKRSLEKERLQRELLLAQEMQKRLLPQTMPKFPTVDIQAASAPALEVGGDYYDILTLDDSHVSIVIGDVAGKGVGAAFYMAEVKGIFQSLSTIYPSPKEFLIKANEALLTSIDKRSFVSLIYAVLNIRSGELIFARAGHCPMLYVTSGKTEYIKPAGMGLGLCSGTLFHDTIEEKLITMKRGDVCIFYTDGVTESRSANGEEFGYDRLMSVVEKCKHGTAEEIKEQIIQSVWNYTDAKGYDDDLTVFAVKWLGA